MIASTWPARGSDTANKARISARTAVRGSPSPPNGSRRCGACSARSATGIGSHADRTSTPRRFTVAVGEFYGWAVARLEPHIHVHRSGRLLWRKGRTSSRSVYTQSAVRHQVMLLLRPCSPISAGMTLRPPHSMSNASNISRYGPSSRGAVPGLVADPQIPPVPDEPARADRFANRKHETMRLHRRPHQMATVAGLR